jgi:hypothetical protein
MLNLSAKAVITFKSNELGCYSGADGLVNVQGFFYSPLGSAAAAVAWGVALKSGSVKGPTTVVAFTTTNFKLQNAWNPTTNKVTIPVSGTYFVDLSARPIGSANSRSAVNGNGNDGEPNFTIQNNIHIYIKIVFVVLSCNETSTEKGLLIYNGTDILIQRQFKMQSCCLTILPPVI